MLFARSWALLWREGWVFLLPHKQDEVWEAWTCLKGRAMIWFDLLAVEELVFFFAWMGFFLSQTTSRQNKRNV